mgnify:CR=1 FL=1
MIARIRSLVATIVIASCGGTVAFAQESASVYPSRPIRLVSSGLAGGLTDVVARAVMQKAGDLLGQRRRPGTAHQHPPRPPHSSPRPAPFSTGGDAPALGSRAARRASECARGVECGA